MEFLSRIEFHLAEICCVFPIQHPLLTVAVVEEIGLVRDVLALAYPARVAGGDAIVATGASAVGNLGAGKSQSFHLKPPSEEVRTRRVEWRQEVGRGNTQWQSQSLAHPCLTPPPSG